jgi:hypothetical protein
VFRGTKITHQVVDLLPGRDPRGDRTFPGRKQGAREQVKARLWIRYAPVSSSTTGANAPANMALTDR